MKWPMILRALALVAAVLLVAWGVRNTRWEEVEIDDPAHGRAATDEVYSLRHVLEGAGATLEVRSALEPLPPPGATLYLDSGLWNIFPERDAHLKSWVEAGGHLVVLGQLARGGDDLRWVPLSFATPRAAHPHGRPEAASAPADAALDADAAPEADDDGEPHDATPSGGKRSNGAEARSGDAPRLKLPALPGAAQPWHQCVRFTETDATAQPAFERGRAYRGCGPFGSVRPAGRVRPTWQLATAGGTLALRVPVGQGDVTGVSPRLVLDNRGLLAGDNALIAAAVLQAVPGRAVWIVGDEAREPLPAWLWHEARTPFLLALAAIALALWRLVLRFGPREAVPPQARRSMGEQVRGTGQFIAATDAPALHAATRQALEEAARVRIEDWPTLDDAARVEAIARALAPTHAIDRAALRASLHVGGGATPPQIVAAIAILEQARRALLRAQRIAPAP